jgi:hypothetical protein
MGRNMKSLYHIRYLVLEGRDTMLKYLRSFITMRYMEGRFSFGRKGLNNHLSDCRSSNARSSLEIYK